MMSMLAEKDRPQSVYLPDLQVGILTMRFGLGWLTGGEVRSLTGWPTG